MTIIRAVILIAKILAWALVVLAPTLGVWVASSLAAYLNGPIWLVCLAGLLLFPLIPVGWDIWATGRFNRKMEARKAAGKEPRERFLHWDDRLIIRTFVLNVAFLAALLATFPQAGFTALATRGDWFTDHIDQETAEQIRPMLFASAEGLSWLYELSLDNPYEYKDEEPLPTPSKDEFGTVEKKKTVSETPDPTPEPKPKPTKTDVPEDKEDKVAEGKDDKIEIVRLDETPEEPEETPRQPGEAPSWPMKDELHPVVVSMPASVETDYASVARYIQKRESDPFLRVKALNDYVTKRLAYDYPMLRSGERTSQEAKAVFDRKTAVCAGYAKLLVAMGQVIGEDIVYVVGVSRDQDGGVSGSGHAWNAAKIEGKWYLLDPTWNDGDYEEGEDKYNTNYLFTPPAVFGQDHLPNDDVWQLRSDPITRGEFVRQPILPPEFFAKGLTLVTPKRSQVEASNSRIEVVLENPRKQVVIAHTINVANGKRTDCKVTGKGQVKVSCDVPHGTYHLKMFAGPKSNWYPFVGQFEVTSR